MFFASVQIVLTGLSSCVARLNWPIVSVFHLIFKASRHFESCFAYQWGVIGGFDINCWTLCGWYFLMFLQMDSSASPVGTGRTTSHINYTLPLVDGRSVGTFRSRIRRPLALGCLLFGGRTISPGISRGSLAHLSLLLLLRAYHFLYSLGCFSSFHGLCWVRCVVSRVTLL